MLRWKPYLVEDSSFRHADDEPYFLRNADRCYMHLKYVKKSRWILYTRGMVALDHFHDVAVIATLFVIF